MKKLIITGAAFALLSGSAQAQAPVGLDSVIVEKYYVSDANDKTVDATGGVLPLHSVTYRVFVDMKPGYTFEAAYGKDVSPFGGAPSAGDHELRIETSTVFFNNIDRGNTTPGGSFTKAQAQNNTVMLDSWLSAGAACTSQFGVLKSEDNGIANAVNADGVLMNADPYAGIPLTVQDGFLATGTVTLEPFNSIGISASQFGVFGDGVTYPNGPLFSTWNASWYSNNTVGNGATGPTSFNRVLIGQFTTEGTFSFMLNLQLGTPTGGVENWVANSPVGSEGTHSTLTYSNTPPINLGITNNSTASFSFNAYPNPANNEVTIEMTKTTATGNNSYTVYGVDGKVILSKQLGTIAGKYSEKVDLSAVAPGLYFIEVTSDGARSTKKITKN